MNMKKKIKNQFKKLYLFALVAIMASFVNKPLQEDSKKDNAQIINLTLIQSPEKKEANSTEKYVLKVINLKSYPVSLKLIALENNSEGQKSILGYKLSQKESNVFSKMLALALKPYEETEIEVFITKDDYVKLNSVYALRILATDDANVTISNIVKIETIVADPNEFR